MSRKNPMITTALFAAALTGAVLAGDDTHAKGQISFNELDADANGELTISEISNAEDTTAATKLNEKWSELDSDQDGTLDRAEFARFEPVMDEPSDQYNDPEDDY
jgi:Ca2+-binding EF-hand superfamily protein